MVAGPISEAFAPSSLAAVDRALAELRRGDAVLLRVSGANPEHDDYAMVIAAECMDDAKLERLKRFSLRPPVVVVTGRRAMVLGLTSALRPVETICAGDKLNAALIATLADPQSASSSLPSGLLADESPNWARPAATLAKLARLLPAVVVVPVEKAPDGLIEVNADEIMSYQQMAARSLSRVGEARVPLIGAEKTRVIAFRPPDGGTEHLAIVIGDIDGSAPVLARLHSECFTGDILGSLRCDCGDQLRGAISEIGRAGAGVLLYLAQEGRGIGLVNKLRAYQLQDAGFDTLDANLQLGFDDDERIYLPAAEMLSQLGIAKVRLLTNNPAKVEGLSRHGIEVTERVPHVFPSNDHNVFYLRTKATRSGHLF